MSARAAFPTPCRSSSGRRIAARASSCATSRARTPACRRARSGATRRRSATCSRSPRRICRCSKPSAAASAAPSRCSARRAEIAASSLPTGNSATSPTTSTMGRSTAHRLAIPARQSGKNPVDIDLSIILGKPPKMLRDVRREKREPAPLSLDKVTIDAAAHRVMRHPTVAAKHFLVSIGDRTVGGLCARDPFVGPWQVPVADCAVTLRDFEGYAGEAMAVGERTPLALIDAPASGRMAVGEALTNIAAARIAGLGKVKLSANWMAAAGYPGEDAALYDTVRAVAMELCPALGVSIPVGKDSLSMQTRWDGKEVVSPLSLIVSAFAPVEDARDTLTPQLRTDAGDTELVLVDLGRGKNRLGGSILAQTHGMVGDDCPDLDDPALLRAFFAAIQGL